MNTLAAYKKHLQEIGKLESAISLLHWDQRTYLPKKGHAARALVLGKLAKMAFELLVSDQLGHYLQELETQNDLSLEEQASIRVVGKAYRRHKSIPPDIYERFTIARSRSESAWEQAKNTSDFELFQPHLQKMVDFSRQFAELYGYEDNLYDALLEEYEPGMTTNHLRLVIEPLRDKLVPFIKRLREEGTHPCTEVLEGTFPVDQQQKLSSYVLKAMGYDFSAGRLDTTIHPFTISTGPRDTRVTTRFIDNNLFSGIFSTMHEGGHALYQQGIPPKLHWSGLDGGASFGIHESQSRMWENMVGKQLPFLKYFQPILASVFPEFARARPEILYNAVNTVTPSLIRVEADEVTYNLHIMLRFELEEQLINGRINVGDLPELWQDAMKRYLGVVPKDDAHGVLQDVHWSAGMFGYFSSYMLGNLCSAQIFAKVKEEIPDLDEQIANGKSIVLLSWLRKQVHRFGKMYEPQDLLQRVTGERLNPSYFTRYITDKYSQIYKL